MKSLLPLLAFACGLITTGAHADTAKLSDLHVVHIAANDTRDQNLKKTACATGQLVVMIRDDDAARSKKAAVIRPIPLYCANFQAGGSDTVTLNTVPEEQLNLTLFETLSSKGLSYEYKLNRGLTAQYAVTVTGATPANFGSPTTSQIARPAGAPKIHTEQHRSTGKTDTRAIPLTPHEKNWLTLDEIDDYRLDMASTTAQTGPIKHKDWIDFYRAIIESNLPPVFQAAYKTEIAKIPSLPAGQLALKNYKTELDGIVAKFAYADSDINLTADELTKLNSLPSASGKKNLFEDYKTEKDSDTAEVDALEKIDSVKTPHDDDSLILQRKNILYYLTVTAYRKKIAAGSGSGNDDPNQYLGLPDGLGKYVNNDEKWTAYQTRRAKDIAVIADPKSTAAAKTTAQGDLNTANEEMLQLLRARQTDPTLKPQDIADMKKILSGKWAPASWQKMCDPYVKPSVGGASVPSGDNGNGNPLNMAAAGVANCPPATQKKKGTSKSAVVNGATSDSSAGSSAACIAGVAQQVSAGNTSATQPTAGAASPNFTPDKTTALGTACISDPTNMGSTSEPLNRSNSAIANLETPPNEKVAESSDPTKPATDHNVMNHVRSGIGGALAGLILGTLFGPVGVLVGATIGFGIGYYGDKYLGSGTGN